MLYPRFKFVILLCSAFIILSGCAQLKEAARGFSGTSTKILDELRPEATKKTFACPYAECYEKVKAILIDEDSYIYAQDPAKRLIAVYVSESDTTPTGVYFTEVDAARTLIEISSPSSFAKELFAGKIASGLALAGIQETKGTSDVQR